ncbi:hypothetical protein ACE0DR_04890 [Azotobacter sp. CWF10]
MAGALVAHQLALAGKDVLILEAGPRMARHEIAGTLPPAGGQVRQPGALPVARPCSRTRSSIRTTIT